MLRCDAALFARDVVSCVDAALASRALRDRIRSSEGWPAPGSEDTELGVLNGAGGGNFEVGKAAFERALFVWPNEHVEMRQGARIIRSSKERL
jgi:hypothetical protein